MEEISEERVSDERISDETPGETMDSRCRMMFTVIGYLIYYGAPLAIKVLLVWYYLPIFNLAFWVMSAIEAIMLLYASMEWAPNRKPKHYPICTLEEFYNRQSLYIAGLMWSLSGIFIVCMSLIKCANDTLVFITIGLSFVPLIVAAFGVGTTFALRHSEENKRLYRVVVFWICILTVFLPSVAECLVVWFWGTYRDDASVIGWTILTSDIVQVLLVISATIHCIWLAYIRSEDDREICTVIELKIMFTGPYALTTELLWCMTNLTISFLYEKYLPPYAPWLAMGIVLLNIFGIPLSFLVAWLICGNRRRSTSASV